MTSVTRPRARSALVSTVVLVLLAGATGCDTGDDVGGGDEGSSSSHGEDAAPVATVTTIQNIGKRLDAEHRDRVKGGVGEVVDAWFDSGFLGEFPRSDYADAFTGFTRGAAADAQRDLDVLTNAAIADQIETATATKRRVRLDVFAYQGHPRGVTAHFVLHFDTKGDLEQSMQVRGDLYLAKDKGEWRIFGYDVDQAAAL